ncbi:hypothetical protein AURDEDRAFT_150014 [Auricularia subglabra TFB-10046 SS5]|nr:hypothetical protein AURDEDRAFT_150014 [Auricularia subglabra TFB-10046 SS5]
MTIHVRKLAPGPSSAGDIETAAQLLVDSFANDPIMPPCLGGEMHLSIDLWRGFIRAGMVGGEVYLAGLDSETNTDGVAIWFPAGTEFLGTEEQQGVWNEMFGKYLNADARRFWELNYETTCNVVLDRVLPKDKHHSMWHLQILGTRVAAQRRGVARALIDHVSELATNESMRLETFTELNVKIYEKLGFVSEGGSATLTSPQGDVTIWGMFRWPRTGKPTGAQ